MVDLGAQSPLDELLPVHAGEIALSDATPAFVTSLMPHNGADKTLSAALKDVHGLALPAVGRVSGKVALRCLWVGRGQYFLVGDKAASSKLSKLASLTDQSDGWAVMRLEGAGAADVLARVCPLDLRSTQFKRGQTARTELAHMMSVVTKTGAGFEVLVMRSFAHTAVHSLKQAMDSVTAQVAL